MKRLKKAAVVLLLATMLTALAACGSNNNGTNSNDEGTKIESTESPSGSENTEDEVVEDVEAEDTEAEVEDVEVEDAEAEDDETEVESTESETEDVEAESGEVENDNIEEDTETLDVEEEANDGEESTEAENTDADKNTEASTTDNEIASDVKKVYVGTMGTYSPFTFTDDDNKLTGYDVEVVRLLDEYIPEVEFEFVTSPWDSLFMGLDSKRYDMIANQISKTPEREEKYLFMDRGYIYVQSQLVVHADDDSNTSLADFEGKTLGGITGDYFTEMMEEYNEENGNPYKMQYYGEDYTSIFIDLDAGRIAATLNDSTVVSYTAKTLGLKIKCVGDVLEESYSYFVFRNDDEGRDLKEKVDKAIEDAVADGSLSKLSIEWFGEDFTQ